VVTLQIKGNIADCIHMYTKRAVGAKRIRELVLTAQDVRRGAKRIRELVSGGQKKAPRKGLGINYIL